MTKKTKTTKKKNSHKIKFLATSDWHSDENLIKQIQKETNLDEIDFIIFGGDLSDKKNDFKKLLEPFKKKDIFMVPGNHETPNKVEKLKEFYNIKLIGNHPIIINDKLAIFGTNYMAIGPAGIPEEEVLENMIQNFKTIEHIPFKIHVNHIPPENTKIGDASPYHPMIGGSSAKRFFLENFHPDISFVGHIHESSGLEEIVNKTKVVNLAQTFKIFEFDLDKNTLKEIKH